MQVVDCAAAVTGAACGWEHGILYKLMCGGAKRTGAFDRGIEDADPIEPDMTRRVVWVARDVAHLVNGDRCVCKADLLKTIEILRAQLASTGVPVLAGPPGAIETQVTRSLVIPMTSVDAVASIALDALQAGEEEVRVWDEAVGTQRAYRQDAAGLIGPGGAFCAGARQRAHHA